MSTNSPDRINGSHISNHPYSPAISSSASSSASSIFSTGSTSVSSVASSVASLTSVQPSDSIQYPGDIERHVWSQEQRSKEAARCPLVLQRALRVPPPPAEQRQHLRRAHRCAAEVTRPSADAEACPMPPVPTLVRQAERKTNFVDNLVGTYIDILDVV